MNLRERIKNTHLFQMGMKTFKELTMPFRKIDTDDDQFIQLGGRFKRDLPQATHDFISDRAFEQWLVDPLVGRIVEITADFVMGEGAKIQAVNERVQEVIDEFWFDEVNDFPEQQTPLCQEMTIFGELLIFPYVNPITGLVQLARIDPTWIKDAIPMPRFPQMTGTIVLKKTAVYNDKNEAVSDLRVIGRSLDPRSAYAGKMDGDVFYFTWGKIAGMRRGHSQLLRTFEWADLYGKRLFNQAEREELATATVWDVTMKGASQEEAQKMLDSLSTPQNASIRLHNENIEWNVLTPDLKAQDFSESIRNNLQVVLGAYGIPEHYFALGGEVNFATAKAMSEPTQRSFKRQQRTMRRVFEKLIDYQLEKAVQAGRLTDAEVMEGYEISMDEISSVDLQTMSAAMVNVAIALQTGEAQSWIKKQDSAEAFASLFSQLGPEIEANDTLSAPANLLQAANAFGQALEARKKRKKKYAGY